ncbi:conserved hypothetical protein [Neospora caninum Liverpool]|uniref:Uncharacterized protein n=1 Tax=Neospora caninum (strain Liverpool) TaxID=572307 RepID=F0VGR1_NEOCL|nr:conserved hypothetical protein [Neospora caninum Liverpool]CBZ52905.1 conserved hypothetical protein [Neospora caninum Liverpool]CEL66887.1 TPA: hypothetical protein BN1204_026930 [Neospora caninum Liverpool]|eukprot:XP_003882937.1 conserved hypothetical protein [Neospora caninum Liverpool]
MWWPREFDSRRRQSTGGTDAPSTEETSPSSADFCAPANPFPPQSPQERDPFSESPEQVARPTQPGLMEESHEKLCGDVFRPFRSQHHWQSSPCFGSFALSSDLSPLYRLRNGPASPRTPSLTLTASTGGRRLSVPGSLPEDSVPAVACDTETAVVVSPLSLPSLAVYAGGCAALSPKAGDSTTRRSISSVSTEAFSRNSITSCAATSLWTDSGCLTPFGTVSPGALSRPLGHPPSTGSSDQSAKSLSTCRSCPASVFASYVNETGCFDAGYGLQEAEEEASEADSDELGIQDGSQAGTIATAGRVRASSLSLDPCTDPTRSALLFVPPYLREKASQKERLAPCSPSFSVHAGAARRRLRDSPSLLVWAPLASTDAGERERKAETRERGAPPASIPSKAAEDPKATKPPTGCPSSPAREEALSLRVTESRGEVRTGDTWRVALPQKTQGGKRSSGVTNEDMRTTSSDPSASREISQIEEKALSAVVPPLVERAGVEASGGCPPAQTQHGSLQQDADRVSNLNAVIETRQGNNHGLWASFQLIRKVKTMEKASLVLP